MGLVQDLSSEGAPLFHIIIVQLSQTLWLYIRCVRLPEKLRNPAVPWLNRGSTAVDWLFRFAVLLVGFEKRLDGYRTLD